MSKIEIKVETKITLELTVGEAGALQAICGYGPDRFLHWFKETHGKYYVTPYQGHVKSLFEKGRALQDAVEKVEKEINKLPKVINC